MAILWTSCNQAQKCKYCTISWAQIFIGAEKYPVVKITLIWWDSSTIFFLNDVSSISQCYFSSNPHKNDVLSRLGRCWNLFVRNLSIYSNKKTNSVTTFNLCQCDTESVNTEQTRQLNFVRGEFVPGFIRSQLSDNLYVSFTYLVVVQLRNTWQIIVSVLSVLCRLHSQFYLKVFETIFIKETAFLV